MKTAALHSRMSARKRKRSFLVKPSAFYLHAFFKKHGGIEETVTVRRISYGVGVEKVFPVHSPSIDTIQVVRNGKVRRAKLYYLRGRVGKSAKVKEKL